MSRQCSTSGCDSACWYCWSFPGLVAPAMTTSKNAGSWWEAGDLRCKLYYISYCTECTPWCENMWESCQTVKLAEKKHVRICGNYDVHETSQVKHVRIELKITWGNFHWSEASVELPQPALHHFLVDPLPKHAVDPLVRRGPVDVDGFYVLCHLLYHWNISIAAAWHCVELRVQGPSLKGWLWLWQGDVNLQGRSPACKPAARPAGFCDSFFYIAAIATCRKVSCRLMCFSISFLVLAFSPFITFH